MASIDKLLKKLLKKPNNFKYTELKRLLTHFNYNETKTGKTSGSRVAFINKETKHIIRLHKPHTKSELKLYQLNLLIDELKKTGVLK